jgi:ketosteroid isomerase-like protein
MEEEPARPTGEELGDRMRRTVEALNERDFDFFRRTQDPDGEFRALTAAAEGRVYHGPDRVEQFVRDFDDVFDDAHWELLRVIEVGDRVVVETRVSGRGRGSGIPMDARRGTVFTYRGGRIWCAEVFTDLDAAVEAARE